MFNVIRPVVVGLVLNPFWLNGHSMKPVIKKKEPEL